MIHLIKSQTSRLLIIPAIALCGVASAQSDINIEFPDEKYEDYHFTNRRNHSYVLLISLDSNSIYNRGTDTYHDIRPPTTFQSKNPAYGLIYFTGIAAGAVKNNIAFLVDDYKSERPTFYIDHNNDLDFTNDGAGLTLDKDVTFTLKNNSVSGAGHQVTLTRIKLRDEIGILSQFYPLYESRANLLPMETWLMEYTYKNKFATVEMEGSRYRIGLHDYNVNGLFNDAGKDKIMVAPVEASITPHDPNSAWVYSDTLAFRVDGKTYTVGSIDPAGRFIIITPGDRAATTHTINGSELLASKVEFFDLNRESEATAVFLLSEQFDAKKYVLIDFWGTWCKPCVASIPKLIDISERYGGLLQLVGLSYGDSRDKVFSFAKNNNLSWPNGLLSPALKKQLAIEEFPTYLLLDANGNVVMRTSSLAEIEAHLEKE